MHVPPLARPARRLALVLPLIVGLVASLGASGQQRAPDPAAARVGGIDVAGMDRTVRPGDDFFLYTNGTWFRRASIPPDKASWGIFAELAEKTDRDTRGLLEAPARYTLPDHFE